MSVVNGSGVISQLKEAEFRLDRVCRQFEQAWRLNSPLTIEQCLLQVDAVERTHLLEELIAAEWELRVRRGDDPTPAEYAGRFPEDAELVSAVCGVLVEEFADSNARGSNATPQPGEHLGDYKIIREVGRGGMGIVYEARQESLGRQVALKVLPARRFRSERELQRFKREAQAVARLHHSHIVEIYGVGEQDGVHYFAMRYVAGRGLDQLIAEWRQRLGLSEGASAPAFPRADDSAGLVEPPAFEEVPAKASSKSSLMLSRAMGMLPDSIDSKTASSRYRAVARIGFQVAEALQYAHDRGIQHRDVKPSNLLIDRHEVVWLSDFGLAKLDLEATEITQSDDLIGTLKYMPPEALTGKIDHRSDIYSLGLTLYELVTWRPVLDGADRAQLLEQVKDPQVTAPRWLAPDVPRDLETIILKAMARDLDQRYQTASDLAKDLERFLNHEPIRARPQSIITKFRRWVERKPLLAFLTLGTLSITSTSLYSFGALYVNALGTAKQARQDRDLVKQMLRIAEEANASSESSRRAAEVSSREAQNRLIQAQRSEAATYLKRGDDFAALAWTAETLRSKERLAALPGVADMRVPTEEEGETPDVADADDLAASRVMRLRLRARAIMEGSPRIVLREWLPKFLSEHPDSGVPDASDQADFRVNRDGIWFVAGPQQPGSGGLPEKILCVSNPERTRLLRWNLTTGHREKVVACNSDGAAVLSWRGSYRVTFEAGGLLAYEPLLLTASAARRPLEAPPAADGNRLAGAWESSDGRWLVVGFRDPAEEVHAGLWDLTTGQLVHQNWLPISGQQLHVEFSSDGQRVLAKSERQTQILDVPDCRPLLPDERFELAASGWSRDGRWFAGQVGNQTQVYQVGAQPGASPQIFATPSAKEISFQHDGGWLALMLPRGRVTFFEQSPQRTFDFQDAVHPFETDAQGFSYSPDGQWYALAHEDGNVRVWNIHNHQPWTGILRHPGAVRAVCWSPAGSLLITCTQNGLLTAWDMTPRATGQIVFHPAAKPMTSARFSPDGSRIVAATDAGQSVVWGLTNGRWNSVPESPALSGSVTANVPHDALGDRLGASDPPQDRDRHGTPVTSSSMVTADMASRIDSDLGSPAQFEVSTQSDHTAIFDGKGKIAIHRTSDCLRLQQWELPAGQHVAAMAFNRDGKLLALAGRMGLQVWETETGKRVTPPLHSDRVAVGYVRFSPDGRYIATVSDHHVCQIRETSTWELLGGGFQLESRAVLAEFHPRDSTFVTVTEAGTLQIWDWSSGEPLTPQLRYPCVLTAADLSADGRRVAVVAGDSLCVWDLPEPSELSPEHLAAWARDVALTDVNTADGTLSPLLPQEFPRAPGEGNLPFAGGARSLESRSQWHVYQANMAHLMQDDSAEEFHIRQLSELNPEHPQLAQLRSRFRPVRPR